MLIIAAVGLIILGGTYIFLFKSGACPLDSEPLLDKRFVLDMHCHVAGIGAGESGAFLSSKLRNSWKYTAYLKAFDVTEAEINQHGDGLIVKRISEQLDQSAQVGGAVLLALDAVIDRAGNPDLSQTESYIPNEFLAEEVARYDNLYLGASVNPHRHDALEHLVRVKEQGAVLLKWLPAIQQIDPACEELTPFYQKLVELDLPLLTHAGDEHAFTSADNRLSDPQRLRLPLELGVTVIVAHAASSGRTAGQSNLNRFVELLTEFPNLYGDISALTQVNRLGYLAALKRRGVASQRLLYGTDFPLINTLLSSPLFSLPFVSPAKALAILKVKNPWDRDLLLKQAHGFPAEVFTNAYKLLLK